MFSGQKGGTPGKPRKPARGGVPWRMIMHASCRTGAAPRPSGRGMSRERDRTPALFAAQMPSPVQNRCIMYRDNSYERDCQPCSGKPCAGWPASGCGTPRGGNWGPGGEDPLARGRLQQAKRGGNLRWSPPATRISRQYSCPCVQAALPGPI